MFVWSVAQRAAWHGATSAEVACASAREFPTHACAATLPWDPRGADAKNGSSHVATTFGCQARTDSASRHRPAPAQCSGRAIASFDRHRRGMHGLSSVAAHANAWGPTT